MIKSPESLPAFQPMLKRRVTRRVVSVLSRIVQASRIWFYRCLSYNCTVDKPLYHQPCQLVCIGLIHDMLRLVRAIESKSPLTSVQPACVATNLIVKLSFLCSVCGDVIFTALRCAFTFRRKFVRVYVPTRERGNDKCG